MKIAIQAFLIIVFLAILAGVIGYARGYRLDMDNGNVTSTGIIAVSAYPKASKVFINGILKGATDLNVTLSPGKYHIEVKKEGYTTWTKDISLKGELVESLDVLLFPINPSLYPLTNLGITQTIAVAGADRFLIFSDNNQPEKDGLYVFDTNRAPLSFLPPSKLILLKSLLPVDVDFSQATAIFSPDLKQAIIDIPVKITNEMSQNFQFPISNFQTSYSYLISLEDINNQIFNISDSTSKESIITAWDNERQAEMNKIMETFPKAISKIATDSFKIIAFSPDKTKVLYQATVSATLNPASKQTLIATNQTREERTLKQDNLYIYDKKEDKNYNIQIPNTQLLIPNKSTNIPNENIENWKLEIGNSIMWYPDSMHLVINEGKKITVIDYDNTNKQTVYSGPFEKNMLGVTTDGKLMVLINLNSQMNNLPDIYAVGIR